MPEPTFSYHFEQHMIWVVIVLGAISVCGGALMTWETMDDDAAWVFLLAGMAWVSLGSAGIRVLQSWAPRRAVAYLLYASLVWNLFVETVAVAVLVPVFILPSIGALAGLILLEYFVIALGYQLWNTSRHFNAQWRTHHHAVLARCFDPARSMLAVQPLARGIQLQETLFLPYWHKAGVAFVSLMLSIALILAIALYDAFYEFALLAGGIASLSIITYLFQYSFVTLLLAFKVLQLERASGCRIGLMDDAGIGRIKAADRRAKRGNKR